MTSHAIGRTQRMSGDQTPPPQRRARIEHVNLTVSDPERSAAMAMALFGWHIRWRGPAGEGSGGTVHVGDDHQYLAFYGDENSRIAPRRAKGMPLNHVAVMVDDLDAVETAARTLGLEPFGHGDYPPGPRFYLFDWDGIEYEIVGPV